MKSKLGFHVDIQGHHGQVEKMIRARPRVIKIITSMGMLNDLHDALGDETIFIARDWKADDDFLRFGGSDDPKVIARRWLDAMRPSLVQAPFAYWESFNEMSNWDNLRRYAEFEAERQRLMAAEGYKACIGNFATGTPSISDSEDDTERPDLWPEFYPALEVAHELGNILGLHEYGGLWMDLWYGPNQSAALRSGNRVPFPEEHYEGWLFARYRKVWRRHIEPNGWTNIRIALTEFGLDMAGTVDTDVLAGYPTGSWRTCDRAWRELDNRPDTEQYYVEQLQWCDRQMQKDRYLIGCTIFTWGTMGELWRDFDIEGPVADMLVDYIAHTRGEPDDDVIIADTDTSEISIETPALAPGEKMTITSNRGGSLSIRKGPGSHFESVASILIGDPLTVLGDHEEASRKIGKSGEWIPVMTREGLRGWVSASFVQPATVVHPGEGGSVVVTPSTTTGELWLRTTATSGLRVRSGSGVQHPMIGSIMPGDQVKALGSADDVRARLGKSGQWIQVELPNGVVGWASALFLEEVPEYVESPVGHALIGLHGPADPGMWPWDEAAYEAIEQARVEAVKILAAGDVGSGLVEELRRRGVSFILARLFAKFSEPRTPQEFVDEVAPATGRLYEAGVRYFEVHNEPNLHHPDSPEGMGVAWQTGKEFGEFFLKAVDLLRERFPGGRFGWPGVSPGPELTPTPANPIRRYDSARFEREAAFAMQQADFICMHTYWGADGSTVMDAVKKVEAYCDRFPDKAIFVSEFSNSHRHIAKDVKGLEYVQFYRELRKLPPNLGGSFAYVLSSSSGFEAETWKGSPIPKRVGER